MEDLEFRRVKKASCVQPAYRNEISPLRSSEGDIGPAGNGAKRPVRSGHASGWLLLSETGARGDLDYKTRLVAVFRGRSAGDHLHRLDRIYRDLVGENLALLIGDGLAVNRK